MRYSLEKLLEQHSAGSPLHFLFFWGHRPSPDGRIIKSCFSQWWPAPFEVNGVKYTTAEQFMMAEKARLFADLGTLEKILATADPSAIKQLGREVAGYSEECWAEHRYSIVLRGNLAKFGQNPELAAFLKQTGDTVLVEASPYDRVWGIGLKADDKAAESPASWRGPNLLGFALMEVRDALTE